MIWRSAAGPASLRPMVRIKATTLPRLTPVQRAAAESREPLEAVIDLIDQARFTAAPPSRGGRSLPARVFNRSVLLADETLHFDSGDEVWADSSVFGFWPFRARILTTDTAGESHLAMAHVVESVTVKDVRGHVTKPHPRMIRHRRARFLRSGDAVTTEDIFALAPDGRLRSIRNGYGDHVSVTPMRELEVRLAAGWALRLEYTWQVDIGILGSEFMISVPTSPEGARNLLSLRDVPAGAPRRAALRHWVRNHRRVVRRGEVDERTVAVRHHLRGATPFEWEDLRGVVRPSPYDLRRAAAAS